MKELELDLVRVAQENEREYIRVKDNSIKERKIAKNKTKKRINKAIYMLGGAALMSAVMFGYTQKVGADKLGQEMKTVIEQNYDIVIEKYDPSMLALLQNGKPVDKDEALDYIVTKAESLGYSKAQISIGLDNYYPSLEINKKIEKPNLLETINTKKEAFLNNELKKGNQK